jgi:hypothetical protein
MERRRIRCRFQLHSMYWNIWWTELGNWGIMWGNHQLFGFFIHVSIANHEVYVCRDVFLHNLRMGLPLHPLPPRAGPRPAPTSPSHLRLPRLPDSGACAAPVHLLLQLLVLVFLFGGWGWRHPRTCRLKVCGCSMLTFSYPIPDCTVNEPGLVFSS